MHGLMILFSCCRLFSTDSIESAARILTGIGAQLCSSTVARMRFISSQSSLSQPIFITFGWPQHSCLRTQCSYPVQAPKSHETDRVCQNSAPLAETGTAAGYTDLRSWQRREETRIKDGGSRWVSAYCCYSVPRLRRGSGHRWRILSTFGDLLVGPPHCVIVPRAIFIYSALTS